MNKTKKLFVIGLLLFGLIFSVASCAKPEEFVPPETGDRVITINDAYDWNDEQTGSTRPELGGGYTPQVPAKDAILTIGEDSTVRFKGGATTLTLPVGQILKQEDFDASTLDGHVVGGVALLDEEGGIRGFQNLSSFSTSSNVTILPYFNPKNGDGYEFGSNKVGDYYYDADGNFLGGEEYALTTENILIDGYMAKKVSTGGTLEENSYFRAVTVCEREAGQTYTYHYKVKNFGEDPVSFTVHQMFTGHAWADGTTNVASQVITLEPGATSEWISLTDQNTRDDGNTLTLIRFNQDVEGFSLGFVMSVENTTPTEPAKITFELPAGFTVSSDYKTDVRTNDKLVLPTASQITNNTGHNLLYWTYEDGTKVVEGVRIQGDIKLIPVLSEDAKISVKAPSGFVVSGYPMVLQTNDKLKLPKDEQITNNTGNRLLYWTYEDGTRAKEGDLVTGDVTLIPVLSENAKIILDLPSGFTVSNSYDTNLQTGDTLTLPTAAQVTNNTGRVLLGWYDVATGQPITSSLVLEETEITIAPYFAHQNGVELQPGYGADNASQPDYVGTYEGTTFTPWKGEDGEKVDVDEVFVSPAQVSYAGGQKGVMIQSQAGYSFKQNDAFRVKTASNPGMDGVITYEIFYTLTNYGKETLDFHVYQIMSQTNLTTATDLGNKVIAPGATITFSVNVKSKNNNLMTMFVFNQAVSGINMKMDMSMQGVAANISFDLPDGIEIADDYNTARHQGETLVLPTAEQIKNSTQYDVIGWTYADGTPANEGDVLKGDVVLKPVLSKDATISFNLPSGIQISDDYVTAVRTGDGLVLPTADQITNTTGKEIVGWTYADGSLAATGDTIEGDIVLVPVLGEDAVITVELPDGLTLSEEYATTQTTGKTLVLPTAEQIEGVPADDREILGWYNVATGEIIESDAVIEDTSLIIAPYWTRRADTATLQNAADSTANGNPLVFCNEQGNLRPAQIRLPGSSSNQTQADWFDPISGGKWVNDTVIEGGEGGYAELGNVVSMVSGKTMEAGMVFRCATVVSGSSSVKVVPVNEPITFYYNFQNFGDSAIHMTMWGVNSGIDYEGEGQTIDLEPGESTTIEFTVTYTKGSDNANIMAFFRVEEAITDMQLGASVNVVLP